MNISMELEIDVTEVYENLDDSQKKEIANYLQEDGLLFHIVFNKIVKAKEAEIFDIFLDVTDLDLREAIDKISKMLEE